MSDQRHVDSGEGLRSCGSSTPTPGWGDPSQVWALFFLPKERPTVRAIVDLLRELCRAPFERFATLLAVLPILMGSTHPEADILRYILASAAIMGVLYGVVWLCGGRGLRR
jgi:hypothetical protein